MQSKAQIQCGTNCFITFLTPGPSWLTSFFNLLFLPLGKRLLEREKPDLVVSTFSVLSYVTRKTLRKQKVSVPLVSIITDAGEVQKLWLMGVEDAVITATKDTIDYAVKQGVPRDILHFFGFPVLEAFAA